MSQDAHPAQQADQALQSLYELEELAGRTRRAGLSTVTGYPLVGWGSAWIVGLGAIDVLEGLPRVLVVALAWGWGMALSWLPLRADVRRGSRGRTRVAWLVVLLASPCLVAAARPTTFANAMLLLGALWGLGMCLYGVATDDRPFAITAGIGVLAAGAVAELGVVDQLLWFGVVAGAPLLVLGVHRARGASGG